MMKYAWNYSFVIALFAFALLTSCNKEDTTETEVEEFVELALVSVAESASIGAEGCFELVFPVSFEFSDGSTTEVNSVEEIKAALRAWKEANPDAERADRPSLVFPVELISAEGEVNTVNSKEELRTLRSECGERPRRRGHHGNRECSCFQINFPLTLQFPDDTTAEVADRADLKSTVRAWKEANPDATERPELVFPISVTLEDGTVESVASLEELKALKESCREE